MSFAVRAACRWSNMKKSFLQPSVSCSQTSSNKMKASSYESDGKTTVTILNKEGDLGLLIDSYSQVGFRLNNGMMVLGPMAIFPRTVLSWSVDSPKDVTIESLEIFYRLVPKIDILVLGMGDPGYRPDTKLLQAFRQHGLNVEILPTEQACTTFNFLNAEARSVAGAFIPPITLRVSEDDVITSKIKQQRLYGPDSDV